MLLAERLPVRFVPHEPLVTSVRFYVIHDRSPCESAFFLTLHAEKVLRSFKESLPCLLPSPSVATLGSTLPVIVRMQLFMCIAVTSLADVRTTGMVTWMHGFSWHVSSTQKAPKDSHPLRLYQFSYYNYIIMTYCLFMTFTVIYCHLFMQQESLRLSMPFGACGRYAQGCNSSPQLSLPIALKTDSGTQVTPCIHRYLRYQ